MATFKKVIRLTLALDNGRESTLTINAAPINDTLTDPDSGSDLIVPAMNALSAGYEADDGASISAYTVAIVTTTTEVLAENQTPS